MLEAEVAKKKKSLKKGEKKTKQARENFVKPG
jgi:hypothetical protein